MSLAGMVLCALLAVLHSTVALQDSALGSSQMHPLGSEVHDGLHSVQQVSTDQRIASHDFAWRDDRGRSVKLTYEAAKHETFAVVHLESYTSIENVTVDDDIMTLRFSSVAAREEFVGKHLRTRDLIVGDDSWNATFNGRVESFMVRVVDVLGKAGREVAFFYEQVGLTDAFRSLDVRYSYTLLPEDVPRRHQGETGQELKNEMRKPSATGRRQLFLFGWAKTASKWFVKTAQTVIKLADKVVAPFVSLAKIVAEYVPHPTHTHTPALSAPHLSRASLLQMW